MGDFFTSNLFVEIVTVPENGMAIVSGSTVVEYTADDAYVGLDSTQYRVCNKVFLDFCDTAWIRYEVSLLSLNEYEAGRFDVYPNPTSGEFTISNNLGLSIDKIQLFSLSGSLCAERQLDSNAQTFTINLNDLHSGVYLLTIFGDDSVHTRKLIIE